MAWLTRPSEFVELREADAVLRLLNPVVPARCAICGHYDWLNSKELCPSCWLRLDGVGRWLSVRMAREEARGRT